jgi:hypothetical protein
MVVLAVFAGRTYGKVGQRKIVCSTKSVLIVVPFIPPSLNVQKRLHHHEYKRLRDSWQRTIYALLGYSDRKWLESLAAAGERMKLGICFQHKKLFDKDNAYGAAKPLIDCFKRLWLLHDDSDEFCELTVTQERGSEKATRIRLERAK